MITDVYLLKIGQISLEQIGILCAVMLVRPEAETVAHYVLPSVS